MQLVFNLRGDFSQSVITPDGALPGYKVLDTLSVSFMQAGMDVVMKDSDGLTVQMEMPPAEARETANGIKQTYELFNREFAFQEALKPGGHPQIPLYDIKLRRTVKDIVSVTVTINRAPDGP